MTVIGGVRIPERRVVWRWAKENLFDGWFNTVLTVMTLSIIVIALYGLGRFVFVSAEWEAIDANRRLFFVGRFPSEETWRVWACLLMLSGLSGLSWGLWARIGPRMAAVGAIVTIPVFLFIGLQEMDRLAADLGLVTNPVALNTMGTLLLFGTGYALGHFVLAPSRFSSLARNVAVVLWLASVVVTSALLREVPTNLWGGLLLTMILTVVGIVVAFPIGVLLALGRASTFPVIRLFCVAYIELIRAVPLLTLFFMAAFILPLALGPERDLSIFTFLTGWDLDLVLRVMVALIMFSSAYLAEIVRGGLQAVPRGQVDAAKALGLGTLRILALIVMPQALRAVIPAIVSQFISLFKDTSLVFIVGLTELLGVSRQVTGQLEFIGRQAEVLVFIALVYWVIAFNMSRASQQLEKNLGVGER